MNSTLSPWPYTSLRDPRLVARVSGYSWSKEYRLDWDTLTATFEREVPTESHSLSQPFLSARSTDGLSIEDRWAAAWRLPRPARRVPGGGPDRQARPVLGLGVATARVAVVSARKYRQLTMAEWDAVLEAINERLAGVIQLEDEAASDRHARRLESARAKIIDRLEGRS